MSAALCLALLLLLVGEARALKYSVAQCGWYVGADASWADSTGGAKFRPDSWCVPAPGADPFDGVHLKSFTRENQATVSGTRFARWRWEAPPGTGITQIRGTWWHALHDGMEQRLGVGTPAGGFNVFAAAATTDTTLREFVAGFATPMPAFEDRLLCARAESKWCSLAATSWSGLRAVTITIDDPAPPGAEIRGGDLVAAGWRRGDQALAVGAADGGSGVRFGETLLDGARVALTEYPCEKVLTGGEWRGTRMRPCLTGVSATQWVATRTFSDGPHSISHCASDFAGNAACTPARTILIDNNPPAHPRSPALAGGEGWRRVNDFDLSWQNPDQGPASPIGGAAWRLLGTNGYDGGTQFAAGRDRAEIANLTVPGPGAYALQVWLRDEAGNEAPSSAVAVQLRLDDVRPGVAFAVADEAGGEPSQVVVDVADEHSGPAAGSISYRRLDSDHWVELVTKLVAGAGPGRAKLAASVPELAPGTYLFRAEASDAAGNVATSTLRADGTEMAVRKVLPPAVQRARTRLFARLGGSRGRGEELTVGFGRRATVSGRLVRADGAGIPGREVQVESRPNRGSFAGASLSTVETGPRGEFAVALAPGPSRRVVVRFVGDESLQPSGRSPLRLRVRAGIELRARPRALRTGKMVRLTGRVRGRGAPMPRRGKVVAIQYLESATKRWRPVLVTRTDRRGRFAARYRFRYVRGLARIRLRAVALAEERWPYVAGASRPLTVRVRG